MDLLTGGAIEKEQRCVIQTCFVLFKTPLEDTTLQEWRI